jgi:hypothetical protein
MDYLSKFVGYRLITKILFRISTPTTLLNPVIQAIKLQKSKTYDIIKNVKINKNIICQKN